MVGGKAGNVISKLCTGQATKNESVNRFAEALGAHWDKEMKYRNEACLDIFKLKNTKMNWKKFSSVQTETKLLIARQVIHPKYEYDG